MQTPPTDGSYYADFKMKRLFLRPHLSQSDVLDASQTAALQQGGQESGAHARFCSKGDCPEFLCAWPKEHFCE